MIRFCCFRYAVDDCTGFRTIYTVNQLPDMFMQAETAERSICCVVIKRHFTVIQEQHFQCFFLIDTVMDPFQCFPFGKTIRRLTLFYPRKESLHQRFNCDLPLFLSIIRFQIRQLIVQMIDGPDPLHRFIRNGIFRSFLCCFRGALLSRPRNTASHMPYLRTGIRPISVDSSSMPFPKENSMTTASRQCRESSTATGYSPLRTPLTKSIPVIMKSGNSCVSRRKKPVLETFWSWLDQQKPVRNT